MIHRLRRKFILISTLAVLAVVALVFFAICILNISTMNRNLDLLADTVSDGGGRFPDRFHEAPPPKKESPEEGGFGFITPETPFATRHFTVLFDESGEVLRVHTDAIYSITQESAVAYARQVMEEGEARGWVDAYRYKVFSFAEGTGAVFIDGSMSRSSLFASLTIAFFVLIACASLVLLLIVLLSGRVVKPIAESYEKQRQFVTDANHELKTPLTLILANLDIAEAELGKNEWLEDIRAEGQRMAGLVNQLVALCRMDEEKSIPSLCEVPLGTLVYETAASFEPMIKANGGTLSLAVDRQAVCLGDAELLQRIVCILMDNAVKYCDPNGEISVSLRKGRRCILTVENTYAAVGELELSRLFDRFYRADKARKFIGGYGVGLSLAKAIALQHKGEITAYQRGGSRIGFKVVL